MKKIILLILFLTTYSFLYAQTTLEKRVEEYITPLVNSTDFYGSILIAKDGKIVLSEGYGYASVEHDVPNTPQTVFHIGSVSKPLTAVGMMLLHQKGKVNINDSVSEYVPDYPNGERITIKNLLSQTSGIPNYNEFPEYIEYSSRENTTKQVVDWFKDKPLEFEPGAQYGYSNSNFVLAAYIIELVSGQSYDSFMRSNVFEPLKMMNTGEIEAKDIVKNKANRYSPASNKYGLIRTDEYNMSLKKGSGSLWSTVEDLFKLDQALYSNTLLNEETKELMFTEVEENNYGLGWGIWPRFGYAKHDHDGASPGSVGYISRYPEEKVTIIFLGNVNSGAFQSMKRDLAAIYFGEEYDIPETRSYIEVDTSILKKYEGRYEFENELFFDLKVVDGNLRFLWMGREELGYLLSPLSETEFYIRARGDQINFKVENGILKAEYVERAGTSQLKKIE